MGFTPVKEFLVVPLYAFHLIKDKVLVKTKTTLNTTFPLRYPFNVTEPNFPHIEKKKKKEYSEKNNIRN